jgi:predicted acyltransferase
VIAEPAQPVHRRARGLDVLRGLTVGWLLVVVHTPTTGLRGHARWFGWDHSDVFFPLFVLLAGMGLALQTRDRMPWGRLVRRFVVLVVLGLLVNAWLGAGPDLSAPAVTGVLQRIALAGLAGALVVAVLLRRWWAVLAAAGGHRARLGPAACGPPRRTARATCRRPEGCGTFLSVDRELLGSPPTSTPPARSATTPEGRRVDARGAATFLAGYAARRCCTGCAHGGPVSAARRCSRWPVAGRSPGHCSRSLQPVAKRLWTPSFVASHAALGIAVLALAVLGLRQHAAGRLAPRPRP